MSKKNSPDRCCQFPLSRILTTEYFEIVDKCPQEKKEDCCITDLIFETTGIYADGKFHKEKLQKTFELDFDMENVGNSSNSNDYRKDVWSPLVEKSIETCAMSSKQMRLNL